MKAKRLLVLGLWLGLAVCRAQDLVITNAGWYGMDGLDTLAVTNGWDDGSEVIWMDVNDDKALTPPSYAEVITPEIQALADGLERDPLRIFNYVHDHIRYVLYFGSKKGAQLTLLEKSGNDFDQCALLVALLRAAGYTGAGYQFGWMLVPYDSPDGSDRDLHHWLGLSLTNSDWSTTGQYLTNLFGTIRSYPTFKKDLGNNIIGFQRVWVTLPIGATTNYLDPAFKVSEPIAGLGDLRAAMKFNSNDLMNAAGGLEVGSFSSAFYVTNLNEAGLRATLSAYTTNLLSYLQTNRPNASVEEVLGGRYIVPSTNTSLPAGLPFATTNMNGTMPIISWVNQPTNLMSTLNVNFGGSTYRWYMPQLQGQRLSLTMNAFGSAQLSLDDTNKVTRYVVSSSNTFAVTLSASHPRGGWNATSNTFNPGTLSNSVQKAYLKTNASYALLYAFEPDWGWLQQRQRKLEAYRQQGLPDTNWQVVAETLNVMGLNWQMQVACLTRILGQQVGTLPMFYHSIGRMSQEHALGYYIDIYLALTGNMSSSSLTDDRSQRCLEHFAYFGSAMEHGLIEQLQATNRVGASTVKLLELANTNHYSVYIASSANWATTQSKLSSSYRTDTIDTIANRIGQGFVVLLPQTGSIQIAGGSSWAGYGYLARNAAQATVEMAIGDSGGVHHGGYVSDPFATVDPIAVNQSGYYQPYYFSSAPASVPNFTGADPVSMADGTFQVQATDLSLGQTEPRGLSLSRFYSSSRRNSDLVGLAPGWLHNYYLKAATLSSPQAGLGGTTPAQMAPLLVATCAADGIYNGSSSQPSPRNWMVRALVAKWAVDQLTGKAVSVVLGKDTVQFIQQPDGTFTPPANCTMTLTQDAHSAYTLHERHGRTFHFNQLGWATNIADPYGQSLTLAYNSNNWVTTVTDWVSRSLTFDYSTTSPKCLLSVTDNSTPSRAVHYNYSLTNLVSVIDPEGNTSTFAYDTNHQITAIFDALSHLVASNLYNSLGRVTTQFTQGDASQTWKIFWSGWRTISQDPAGGKQTYFYDDKTRLIAQQDALGNLTRTVYDGQDHALQTVSPLNEVSQFIYDGNHNLLYAVDPLGFTNQFIYDADNNLRHTVDARGNVSSFAYNAQFSLIAKTNGAGDWATTTYNSDGTILTRTDAGGETRYGYDLLKQVNSITYPGSLGGETFINSTKGDVLSHANGRGFTTTFQYNQRRELTNTTPPDSSAIAIRYDAVGNRQSVTDPRGFTTTAFWSPTRHQTSTVYPATPQGVPATTNFYDSRDWLTRSLDPLQHATLLTNDAAGHSLSVTDPVQRTTRLGYDPDGRQIGATNAAGEAALQQWDARGKLLKATDPATHFVLGTYDPAGNQLTLTNRKGNGWQFQFDGANRVTNTITPKLSSTRVTFDSRGLPRILTPPSNHATTNYYDGLGRLTNSADALGVKAYAYDANNNLTNLTEVINSQASSLAFSYDSNDRLTNYQDAAGNVIQYRYDASGNLTNLIYPGNRVVRYFYDSLSRLTNVTDWASRRTIFTYDLASRVTSITRPNNTVRLINYDAAGETTNIIERTTTGFPIAFFTLNWTNSGRVAWEFGAPLPHAYTPPGRTNTFDEDNRLATFNGQNVTNDSDGNLIWGPITNNTLAAYTYDARNRLTSIGGWQLGYDPGGSRASITTGTNITRLVVNPNAPLSQVLMRIQSGRTVYYVYGLGLLYEIAETATSTNTLAYHYDYRGSTIALSDASGTPTDHVEYSSYGMLTYRAGTNDTPFLYNGRYGVMTDSSGLCYMRARYYNPYLCRFINADPAGFTGGLNLYAYADCNPISMADPFGLGAREINVPSWLSTPSFTGEQLVQGLLNFAFGAATLPLDMIGGYANDVNTAVSGQDAAGNQVSGLSRAWSTANVVLPFVPVGEILGAGSRLGAAAGAAAESTAGRNLLTQGSLITDSSRLLPGVSGSASDIVVLGRQVDTAVAENWAGYRTLNIQNWTLQANDNFMQAAISQRQTFYLGSPVNYQTLWNPARNSMTVFARELAQAYQAGYQQSGLYLIPPHP